MDKKPEQNGTHMLKPTYGNNKSKEQEARLSMTKSTSGLNSLKHKETIVSIRGGNDTGCYFTRIQVGIFMFAFVLSLAVVVFLVVFFGNNLRPPRHVEALDLSACPCAGNDVTHSRTHTAEITGDAVEMSRVFPCADEQKFDIRLPPHIEPMHYDLDLFVDLNNENKTFEGQVTMRLNVVKSTRYVVFHVKPFILSVSKPSLSIRPLMASFNNKTKPGNDVNNDVINKKDDGVGIVSQRSDFEKELYIVELKDYLKANTEYLVTVGHFKSSIYPDLKGIYLSSYKNEEGEKKYLAASQLQSTDARKVFPCFDEPAMKATFAVSITHQAGFTALGNMPVESEQCVDDCKQKKVTFQTTPRMSTYLLAFVVSDFKFTEKVMENNFTTTPRMSAYLLAFVVSDFKFTEKVMENNFTTTPRMSTYLLAFVVSDFKFTEKVMEFNFTLRMWSQPDIVNQTLYALEFASKTYAFFTDYFQIPDVVPKADHVAVPDFSGGAMENWGLVIYRETALLYDPDVSSSQNKYLVTLIVAHEIAHMWFGNMVTMRWWDDLWLNEGFACTLMYLAMDHVYPDWNVLDIVVVEDMYPVMIKDALPTSHPVSTQINHPDEIAESFDQISYNKGNAVLRMLETFLGKEGFRLGLQSYVSKYKFKNAEMSELWATFTEVTNYTYNIGQIMDTWTRQMGYPVIMVKDMDDHFFLEQKRFLINDNSTDIQDDSIYGYKWYVPFTYRMEGDTDTKLHWLNMGPGKVKKTSEGWLLGNINYGGFYRVNYEPSMWRKLSSQLDTNHTAIGGANRAGLIGDAFNLARASMLDYAISLNLTTYLHHEENYVLWKAFLESLKASMLDYAIALNLTTYLHHEESYVPWKAFLESLEFIRGMLSKQSAYVLLEKYIRERVAPVLQNIGIDESGSLTDMYLRRMLLRTGCDVGVKEAIKYAKDKFNEWMQTGIRLPTDYAQVIYAVGIREGSVEEWDYVWTRSRMTNSPSEREMMLEALAHTQKPWLLWRYANWIFDGNKIKTQDVRLVMSYFSNTPMGRMIALHFLMNRWDELNDKTVIGRMIALHNLKNTWDELNDNFGDDTFIIREMIGEVTAYVNTHFELRQLELLFSEKPPKGARKGADSALELIRSNINWMESNYRSIDGWLQQHVESSF